MSILGKYFSKTEMKNFVIVIGFLVIGYVCMQGWYIALEYAKLHEAIKIELQRTRELENSYRLVSKPHTVEIWKNNELFKDYPKNTEFTLEFKGR
jgi:hypothetical protein